MSADIEQGRIEDGGLRLPRPTYRIPQGIGVATSRYKGDSDLAVDPKSVHVSWIPIDVLECAALSIKQERNAILGL
jgi:hypothetical protein